MGYTHFSRAERLELAVLRKKGYAIRDIANVLRRSPSSVSRELRSGSVKGVYDPHKAQQKARVRRLYSKYQGMKVRERPELEQYIQKRLMRGWTPEQIAGRLREAHGGKTVVTAKTIYKWLYSVYGQSWCRYLPSRRYRRRKRRGKKRKKSIPNR
jgi:IS30 family transposase